MSKTIEREKGSKLYQYLQVAGFTEEFEDCIARIAKETTKDLLEEICNKIKKLPKVNVEVHNEDLPDNLQIRGVGFAKHLISLDHTLSILKELKKYD